MDNLIGHDIKNIPRTADVWTGNNTTFKDMHFSGPILQGLEENGFVKPSPIQLKALPLARCGFDLIVQSKSGTGKTLVFVLSTLEVIDVSCTRVQCIVLTPTREIAMQVAGVFSAVGCKIKDLLVKTFIGGLPLSHDIMEAEKCHIAVGAPGRIRQLIEQRHLKTEAVRLFILDEADQLMDASFQPDINFIYWRQAETKQVLALSATYPPELVKFLSQYLRTGRHVTPSTDPVPILRGISQFVSITRRHPDATARLIDKEKRLVHLLASTTFNQAIIFSNYQSRAESTCNMLKGEGWSACWISAGQKQEARIKTMEEFRSGRSRVLVSTDLTSRGIDSKTVDLVINLDSPWDPRVYLHRMGRAGRFGSHGIVITILSDCDVFHFRKMFGLISGDSLYVCVIPPEGFEDLRSVDKTKLKKIYGVSPESPEAGPETEEAPANTAGKSKVKDINSEPRGEKETSIRANLSKSKADYDRICKQPCNFPPLSGDPKQKDTSDVDDNKENKLHNLVRKKSYSDMIQGEKSVDDLGKVQQAEKRKRMYCDVLRSKDRGYHFDDNVKETHFTGQKIKEIEKASDEMSFQDLNTYFMKSNSNNEPLSFSCLTSSKEKFLGLKHSTDRPNDKSDSCKIEHEGCDIFEFKAKPADSKLMSCPSVEESKAAKLLLEADEKSPKKKNVLKKKERKSSDRDSKETNVADVLNHYLTESINEVHLEVGQDGSEKSDSQAHRKKRQAKKKPEDSKTSNEEIFDVASVQQNNQIAEDVFTPVFLALCVAIENSQKTGIPLPSEAFAKFHKDFMSSYSALANGHGSTVPKCITEKTQSGESREGTGVSPRPGTSQVAGTSKPGRPNGVNLDARQKTDFQPARIDERQGKREMVEGLKTSSERDDSQQCKKTGIPVSYETLSKCHDIYVSSSSGFADREPVPKCIAEGQRKSLKGTETPSAGADTPKPLCREDFLKHHVLTKKASTKRSPRFEGYLSDTSSTEGEYILSQSYLNKAHHRHPRSLKKVLDPYQDWSSMYKYQLSTITNYVEFSDHFNYFP